MIGETGNSEIVEAHMLRMAENLIEQLEAEGWYITNKEVGMMHDDRRGYDVMGQFGKPLNLMMQVPSKNVYDEKGIKLYPDDKGQ